jgi:RNA-binding protein YlmH
MTKTELLNKITNDPDERILLARVLDKLEATRNRSVPTHTPFLSPQSQTAVSQLIAANGHPRHVFLGGFVGAERAICVFLPDWMEETDWLSDADCPISALRATFPAGIDLNHRDFLGSLMGLGITREKLGDLLVSDGCCDLILLRELEDFLLLNMESAGRTKLKLSSLPLEELALPDAKTTLIRDTVATLRLDAVVSSGFSLARSKAAALISSGRVQLNHRECDKPDRAVAEGDVLSCRGMGKCVVKQVLGQSKKGRIMLLIERYQ